MSNGSRRAIRRSRIVVVSQSNRNFNRGLGTAARAPASLVRFAFQSPDGQRDYSAPISDTH